MNFYERLETIINPKNRKKYLKERWMRQNYIYVTKMKDQEKIAINNLSTRVQNFQGSKQRKMASKTSNA